MDFFNDMSVPAKFLLAFIVVLAVLGAAGYLMRRFRVGRLATFAAPDRRRPPPRAQRVRRGSAARAAPPPSAAGRPSAARPAPQRWPAPPAAAAPPGPARGPQSRRNGPAAGSRVAASDQTGGAGAVAAAP